MGQEDIQNVQEWCEKNGGKIQISEGVGGVTSCWVPPRDGNPERRMEYHDQFDEYTVKSVERFDTENVSMTGKSIKVEQGGRTRYFNENQWRI